jgi:energy-coupling factor transporter ATP-binding protein EcfA2
MSTIINNLSLCNFFNYYGGYENNFYEFNPGLNVIIADNGNGKSKLFSAFSWILKDEVIDSDKDKDKMVKVEKFIIMMISDKAKNETPVNSDVNCGVRINYSDETFEYEVEKSAWARRLKGGSPTDSDNWVFGLNDTKVSKKDKYLLDFRPVADDTEKKGIIERLIRPHFLKYALFQGEEVDNILNFNDQHSLKSALL